MRSPVLVALAVLAQAAPAAAVAQDAAALVAQLGVGGPGRGASEAAERALERMGKPAVPALLKALHARDHDTRREDCVRLLAKIDPDTALRVLPPLLDEPGVRRETIVALGRLGPRARPLGERIRPFVNDPDFVAAIDARVALVELLGETEPHLHALATMALDPAIDGEQRDLAVAALWSLGDRAQPVLPLFLAALKSPDARERRLAAHAFNSKGPDRPEIVAALVDVMEHDAIATIRDTAAGGLATIGPPARSAVPALMRILDGDPAEGWIYALALIEIGDARALPSLQRALHSRWPQTRATTSSRLDTFHPAR